MKTPKKQVYWALSASIVNGGSLISRGLFDRLCDAVEAADAFPFHEIWRLEDREGRRYKQTLEMVSGE